MRDRGRSPRNTVGRYEGCAVLRVDGEDSSSGIDEVAPVVRLRPADPATRPEVDSPRLPEMPGLEGMLAGYRHNLAL